MGKKKNLPFLSMSSQATPSWPWPSCGNPKTLSFRSTSNISKTVNSIDVAQCQGTLYRESHFSATCTKPDDVACNMTMHRGWIPEPDDIWLEEAVEEEIIGLRSNDRLFFDLEESRSILEGAKDTNFSFKESMTLMLDSQDPYVDFKKSMEEMVQAHGLRNWEDLEELLNCYLRVNDKNTHGYVIGAFVDLLVGLSFSSLFIRSSNDYEYHGDYTSSNYANDSTSSPLSFSFSTISSSPCLSSLDLLENDVEKEVDSG